MSDPVALASLSSSVPNAPCDLYAAEHRRRKAKGPQGRGTDAARRQRAMDRPSADPALLREAQGTRRAAYWSEWFWVLLPKQKYLVVRGRNPAFKQIAEGTLHYRQLSQTERHEELVLSACGELFECGFLHPRARYFLLRGQKKVTQEKAARLPRRYRGSLRSSLPAEVARQAIPGLTVNRPHPCGRPAGLIRRKLRCSARQTGVCIFQIRLTPQHG